MSHTPIYSKYEHNSIQKNKSTKLQSGGNVGFNDDFDDLLSNLMSKQQMKKSRRGLMQPYSSQNLGQAGTDVFNKTTQKFNNPNIESDINLNYGLSKGGNKDSKKSFLDDLGSEDNKSYKSGATGKRDNQVYDSLNIFKNNQPFSNQPSQGNVSIRGGMRPPLKKKAQSREPSIFNEDNKSVSKLQQNFDSVEDLDIISVTPRVPKRNNTTNPDRTQQYNRLNLDLTPSKQKPPFKGFQPQRSMFTQKPSIIQQKVLVQQKPVIQQKIIQKIIHIKQDNKELTQRHQEQIKLLKQSYERQIINLKQNYQKSLKQQQQHRKNLMRTYQQSLQNQKKKWQKMLHNQGQRIKSLYEWQNNKKTQSYQLEVKKLKQILDSISKNQQKKQNDTSNITNQTLQFQMNIKIKDFQRQRQRFQQQKRQFDYKKRQLQSEEQDFQLHKRKQQNKLNQQRKKLFQYETQIRKRQVQIKKQFLTQKQALASELVQNQLILSQAKESIRHEHEKLNLQKDLFNQQKMQYEKINNKVLNDLKQRQKLIEIEKQDLNNLQIQLYKKINTVQLMAAQKGMSANKNNLNLNGTLGKSLKKTQGHRSMSVYQDNHKENYRNRINSQLDNKIVQTKSRYTQMEQMMRKNSTQRQSLNLDKGKIHLQKYIQKLTKDKIKHQNI